MTTCRKRTDHRPMDGHDPKCANLRALPRDVGDSGVLQERQYGAEVYVCDAGGLVDESANY